MDQTYPNIVEVVVAAAADEAAGVARAAGATVIRNEAGTTPAGSNLAIALATMHLACGWGFDRR